LRRASASSRARLRRLHIELERLATLKVLPAKVASRTVPVLKLDALVAARFRRAQGVEGVDDVLRGAIEIGRAPVRRFEQSLLRVALSSCRGGTAWAGWGGVSSRWTVSLPAGGLSV
jgi:hypothetical protein